MSNLATRRGLHRYARAACIQVGSPRRSISLFTHRYCPKTAAHFSARYAIAVSHIWVRARAGALAYVAAGLIGLGAASAGGEIDQTAGSKALPKTNCSDQNGCSRGAHAALAVNSRGGNLAAIDSAGIDTVPTWKSVSLGRHDSANSLREALKAAGCHVGDLASEVFDRPEFTVGASRRKVELAILSLVDLGLGPQGATRAVIYERAARLGLGLASPEIAAQLRLQYPDQPIGEFLLVAMEPLKTARGDFVDLSVANGGAGLLLIAYDAQPNRVVPPRERFVFVRYPIAQAGLTHYKAEVQGGMAGPP
jgi:hypothetical protein